MAAFIVKTPVNHDGEDYKVGDPIELTAKLAAPLQQVGAIEPAQKAAKPKEPA